LNGRIHHGDTPAQQILDDKRSTYLLASDDGAPGVRTDRHSIITTSGLCKKWVADRSLIRKVLSLLRKGHDILPRLDFAVKLQFDLVKRVTGLGHCRKAPVFVSRKKYLPEGCDFGKEGKNYQKGGLCRLASCIQHTYPRCSDHCVSNVITCNRYSPSSVPHPKP